MIKSLLKNTSFWIKISHSLLYQRIRNPSNYRRLSNELNFYGRLLGKKKLNLIFDIGANIGNKSMMFSRLAKKVLAFEPSKKCFLILDSRFKLSNVTLFNVALGRQEGKLDFYEVTGLDAFNSLSKKHIETTVKERTSGNIPELQTFYVPVHTVETYIIEYGIPDYMKIDVEGFEVEVIKGLKSVVPLISFEANLPEFLNEAIESINYLSEISDNNYFFKFAVDTSFLIDEYISKVQAIRFLQETDIRYLEIYAQAVSHK